MKHRVPKLIALDIDGTLLRSDKGLSHRNKRAIQQLQAQGIMVIVCTGRPPRTARAVIEELEIGALAALYNGALIYDFQHEKMLTSFSMSRNVALNTLEAMKVRHPNAMAAIETEHGWYTEQRYYEMRKLDSELLSEPTGVGELPDFMHQGVVKILFRHPNLTSAILAQTLDNHPVHCTWSFDSLLEVSAEGVNKATALRWIAQRHRLEASEVAAFGDQNNDKEMLAWAGFGVAMANAVEEAKAAADFITTSNDDDGVARVLESWL